MAIKINPKVMPSGKHHQTAPPPLTYWRTLANWVPQYGDYIIWAGWFSQWHGVVTNYDRDTEELSIIFGGLPSLLFTLTDDEQKADTRKLKLSRIKGASKGVFAVMQHDTPQNASIWYI